MAKVYAVNVNGRFATEIRVFHNTREQHNSVWTMETGSTNRITKISEIEVKNDSADNKNISNSDDKASLELEKYQHEWKANQRMKLLKKILSNETVESNVPKALFSILITILVSSACPFSFTLIPVHNLIIYPSYWYEIIFQGIPWCMTVGIFSYVAGYVLNIEYIKRIRHIVVIYLVSTAIMCLTLITDYCIWTYALHFQFPMPLTGYAFVIFECCVAIIILWFRFPIGWRTNTKFRRRLKFTTLLLLYNVAIAFQYQFVSMLINRYQNGYQPILALIFDVLRELNSWIFSKFITRTANGDESDAQFVGACIIGIGHTVMICYFLVSSATLYTSILLIGLDFFINIYLTLRIVWINKRRPENIEKQIDLLQELSRNELVEFMAPLSYLIAFVIAYYGPNSDLIGGVGATIWQFVAIEDIKQTISIILLLFFIDICSTVVSSIILWVVCKISLFKVCMAVETEYGVVICVLMGSYVITFFATTFINLGPDLTGKFAWIYGPSNDTMTNSTVNETIMTNNATS